MRPFFLLSGLSNEGLGNIFFISLVRLSCAFVTLPYLIVLEEKLIYLFRLHNFVVFDLLDVGTHCCGG